MTLSGRKKSAEKTDNPFGVLAFLPWDDDWNNHMYTRGKALRAMDLIRDAGIKWARIDFARTRVQPAGKDSYDFERLDWLVKELRQRDIRVLGVLGYSPPWASESGDWLAAPGDIALFAGYAAETVKRYTGMVRHWEIWNEPNLYLYWQPQDGLKTYAELLKASYRAAKEANPDCVISNGGISVNNDRDLETLYKLGLKDYFDFYNLHLFVGNNLPGVETEIVKSADKTREIMEKYGDADKGLWITEMGFIGLPPDVKSASVFNQTKPDENQQAELLTKTVQNALGSGKVEKIFWAFFQDTDDFFPRGLDYMGLIRGDFSLKPSYKAYQEMINSYKKR